MRQVKTANGKSRPKKPKQTNPSQAGISPKTRKSRKSDSKAPSRNESFERSKSKEAVGAVATRENSVSSHCKCSPGRRDFNTL
jgi:hypothetical protein